VSGTLRFRIALLAVGALWLGARVAYWNGFYTEDAPGYVTDAIWMALGNYHARDHVNGLNVGTYLPVALPIRLFGKSEIALGLWPLACSLLGFASLAGTCRILLGRRCALLAAFLYASYPGDVFFSTVVMPDALQAGWLSFAIYLVTRANAGPESRRPWMLAASGLAVGICHLVRASDVLLVPVGACAVAFCAMIWQGKRPIGVAMDCGAYFVGWAAVVVAEGLVYAWASHDVFHRVRVVIAHYGTLESITRAGLNTSPWTIPFSLFAPILWLKDGGWGAFNPEQAYHGLMFVWAVFSLAIGAGILLTRRDCGDGRVPAAFAVSAIWLGWPLLYHQFGSQSVTHFVPIHRLSRHLIVYAPGAMLAIATGCALAFDALRRSNATWARGPLAAGGVAILILHTSLNVRAERIAYWNFHQIKDTYARIRAHLPSDVRTIIADPGDLCFFDFWMNPLGSERVRMVPFAAIATCEQIRDGVVLTQSNPGWQGNAQVIQDTVSRLPCLIDPPANWRQVYQGYPEKVFQVAPRERDARE
jgi:4-amino-4-deoxy-L-arabinose transferase-like glycosyltransferase